MDIERQYLKSHRWLRFAVDLRGASTDMWILLGEAQSKLEHIAAVPLQPETAKELHLIYLAKGVLATTAIEGNTLSEGEVRQLLEGSLRLPPSREYLAVEIENIVRACDSILKELVRAPEAPIRPEEILALNRRVLEGLELGEGIVPGAIRLHSVVVGRYRGAPAEDCEHLLGLLCSWLNSQDFDPRPGMNLPFAILKAVIAHLYLAWIHPFGDGNGRTARLLEFRILTAHGVPSPAAHLLSNHYNRTKAEYYRHLDRSSQGDGDVSSFVEYAVRGFVDGLREQLDIIREQQWRVAWENYVHDRFRDGSSGAATRQRHLVLDLSRTGQPVPVTEIKDLSPRLARAYADRTTKTLSRDLHSLVAMDLIEVRNGAARAKRERILAFLPERANREEP